MINPVTELLSANGSACPNASTMNCHTQNALPAPTHPHYSLRMMRSWIWKPVALGLGTVLLAVGVRTIVGFLPSRVYGNDFAMGYAAGRFMLIGRDVYAVRSLNEPSVELGLPFHDKMGRPTNPPLLVWVFRWLAQLEPATAFWLWTTIEAFSLAFVLFVCWRLIGDRLTKAEWVLTAGLTVCSMPVFANFWFGQVQLPITALIMAGFCLSRSAIACVPLTLAAALKLFPWPLMLKPILGGSSRHWWFLGALSAGLLLIWAAVPGWLMWQGFFQHSSAILIDMASGRYYNYTITSFLSSIMGTQTGRVFGAAASVGLIVLAWALSDRALRRGLAGAEENSACLLLIATLMGSLVCWTHYLVLLVYPLICLGAQRRASALGLLVAGLVAVNVAGTNPFSEFPQALRLLGANFPLFVIAMMYVYFSERLRGKYT